VKTVVRTIMYNAPLTVVLASATLPPWDALPKWWKGKGDAKRAVVTQVNAHAHARARVCVCVCVCVCMCMCVCECVCVRIFCADVKLATHRRASQLKACRSAC